jgi:hypothetical protein
MRKLSIIFIVSMFILPLVSAQYYGGSGGFFDSWGAQGFLNTMTQAIEPILIGLFGGHDYTGYLLFEKLLLFILVSVISYLALTNLPIFEDKNKHLARLIAIIVALIGIRNLDYLWFNTIFTQYAVLFVAIAGILPFLIYWFFLKEMQPMVRKIGWIFFAVVYFGLWITTEVEAHEEVYLITALAVLGYAFFLDNAVYMWLAKQEAKKGNNTKKALIVAGLNEDIHELLEQKEIGGLTPPEEKIIDDIVKKKRNTIKKVRGW